MTDPERTDWPAVTLAVGAGVVAAFQVGKAPIALPFIRAEMGLDLSSASWVLSILALLGASMGGAMGSLVTRLGARRLLPGALVLVALASLGGAAAPSLGWLLASRAIEGIGVLVTVISAPALIALATHPRDRQTAFGLWGCFMPTGMALAMIAAPLLPMIGWRGLWLAMAVLLGLYAVAIQCRMPRQAPPATAIAGHIWNDLIRTARSAGPALLALTFTTYTAAYMALTGFLPTLLIDRMGVSPGQAGVMTAGVAASNALGNLATGPLLRLGAPRWLPIITASAVIGATALGIFAPATPPALAYGLCLVFSTVGGMLPGCVLGGAAVLAPERRLVPVTLGLVMQGSNLGQMLGPVVVGAAVSAWGWGAAGLVLVLLSLAGMALALALRRTAHAS